MPLVARRMVFEEEREPHAPAPAATPIVFHDTVVRVRIIDEPPRPPHDGTCRCEACGASHLAEWAELFL